VQANAYTVGQHLVFGPGQYAPHTNAGRRLVAHELAHVVQQSDQPPVIQRQPSSAAGPAAQRKSRLVQVERYWGSTSARAFFADGTNEEVTFVDTRGLDGASRPEGPLEAVVRLTIDRSPSLIRPRVERASGASGSKVSVATRPSPADRISTLPGRVRGEVSEAFLSDPESQPDPETMEFAAGLGERLKESSDTMRIEMKGRDPATVAAMQTVDRWVSDQQSDLDKVGTYHRARFTQLLKDIRQIGVTGQAAADDLDAQDVELVLSGAAGGQSEFQTFDEFKRRTKFDLRSGRTSIPAEHADNPDFFIRNEYRKAWKAEAAGLRKMSRIAEAAQLAPFKLLAASAAVGSGVALLEGGAAWLAGRGVPYALQAKWAGASFLTSGALSHFLGAREEAKAAGMDPNSALGIGNTFSAALLRTVGIGEVSENLTNTSILTQKPLNRSGVERIVGGATGLLNTFGTAYSVMPEVPKGFSVAGESAAAESGAAKARIKEADAAVGSEPATSAHLADQPVGQGTGGRFSQSAELNIPGPHPFFKGPGAMNENIPTRPPQAQAAEIPLASTGTADIAPARIVGDEAVQTGTGAGGAKMSGGPKSPTVADQSAGSVQRPLDLANDPVNMKPAVEGAAPSPISETPIRGNTAATSEAAQRLAKLNEEISALERQVKAAEAASADAWKDAQIPKAKLSKGAELTADERALVEKHNDLMRQKADSRARLSAKRAERNELRPSPFSKEGRAEWEAREQQLPQLLGDILGKENVYFKPKIARVGSAQLPIPLTEGTLSTKLRGRLGLSTTVTPEAVARLAGRNVMFDAKGAGKHSWSGQKYVYEGLTKDGQGVVVVGKPGLKAGEVVSGKVVLMGPAELGRLAANPTIETLLEIIGP
jgi:hypothetical protein